MEYPSCMKYGDSGEGGGGIFIVVSSLERLRVVITQ